MLQARALTKDFGPVRVLHAIDLDAPGGEVHAVIGENGAGKSTLMKLLAGYEPPSSGRILLDGAEIGLAGPHAAEQAGIVLVHQELLLSPALTVTENLFLGRELRRGPFLDRAAMRGQAQAALDRLGCKVDPDAPVAAVPLAGRQMVQVARALLIPHRVVILDEPTAVLTPLEAAALFQAIRALRDRGVAVLYISHRLGDVEALADRVTVLRDGHLVASQEAAALSQLDMARLMVGRDMSDLFPPLPPAPAPDTPPLLEVRRASVPGFVEDASFSLRAGEILGFAGMTGAGRTELMEGVLGLRPARVGAMLLDGAPLPRHDVAAAARAGIAYLTEDRAAKGLLLGHGLGPNLTLMALDALCRGPLLDPAQEQQALARAIADYEIRIGDRAALAGHLSGGNQQKLLLARVMLSQHAMPGATPRVLIVDEPTRGIDIGTKGQIYRFLHQLAEAGTGVVVISSEMTELLGLCHRILVMRHGRIVGDLRGGDLTEEKIVVHATGVTRQAAWVAEHAP